MTTHMELEKQGKTITTYCGREFAQGDPALVTWGDLKRTNCLHCKTGYVAGERIRQAEVKKLLNKTGFLTLGQKDIVQKMMKKHQVDITEIKSDLTKHSELRRKVYRFHQDLAMQSELTRPEYQSELFGLSYRVVCYRITQAQKKELHLV